LVESFADQRPRDHVVPTDPSMDLHEEFLALLGRDTFYEHSYPRWAAFVKFAIEGSKSLGTSSNPSCLGSVSWEDLIEEVGQKRRPLVGVDYRCVGRGSRNLHREAVGVGGR
jgi:hypothetical protein